MSKSDFLLARDLRQELITQLCAKASEAKLLSVCFVSFNIPGPEKCRPGLDSLLMQVLSFLQKPSFSGQLWSRGIDRLGPYAVLGSPLSPHAAKKEALGLEHCLRAGRLLDIDIYDPVGKQLDRCALGLEPRRCLVCQEPARECILLARHSISDLVKAVDALLAECR